MSLVKRKLLFKNTFFNQKALSKNNLRKDWSAIEIPNWSRHPLQHCWPQCQGFQKSQNISQKLVPSCSEKQHLLSWTQHTHCHIFSSSQHCVIHPTMDKKWRLLIKKFGNRNKLPIIGWIFRLALNTTRKAAWSVSYCKLLETLQVVSEFMTPVYFIFIHWNYFLSVSLTIAL